MIKAVTIAAFGVLNLLAPSKPQVRIPEQRRYDTSPLPHISEDLARFKPPAKPRAPRKPRKKHACPYSAADLWGAFLFGLVLGGVFIYLIL